MHENEHRAMQRILRERGWWDAADLARFRQQQAQQQAPPQAQPQETTAMRFLTEVEKAALNRKIISDFIDAGLLARADREEAIVARAVNPALYDRQLLANHDAAQQILAQNRKRLDDAANRPNALRPKGGR